MLDDELSKIIDINMSDFGFIDKQISENIIDNFFESDAGENAETKQRKTIICPKCGEVIEI